VTRGLVTKETTSQKLRASIDSDRKWSPLASLRHSCL